MSAIAVGKVVGPHGLAGMVKVFPYTNKASDFNVFTTVYSNPQLTGKLEITAVKYQKKFVLLKFKRHNHIDDVAPLKNCELYIDKDAADQQLAEDEYYIADLVGLVVIDQHDRLLGKVTGYRDSSSQVVLEVTHADKQWFLPFVDNFIAAVSLQENVIQVKLIEGLYDED